MAPILRKILHWMFWVAVLVTAPISIPLLILGYLTETVFIPKEWAFKWKMFRRGRFLSMSQLAMRIRKQHGTLILDSPTFSWGITRLWWTEDNLISLCPFQEPNRIEKGQLLRDGFFEWEPCDRWMWETYLNTEQGQAYLIGVWHCRKLSESLHRKHLETPVIHSFSGGQSLEQMCKAK